jgi:hypothetical protein
MALQCHSLILQCDPQMHDHFLCIRILLAQGFGCRQKYTFQHTVNSGTVKKRFDHTLTYPPLPSPQRLTDCNSLFTYCN